MGSCESLMLDLAGGGLVYHRRRSSSVGQSQGSAVDAISYADAADVEYHLSFPVLEGPLNRGQYEIRLRRLNREEPASH